ncbi:hypothetical protein [Xanthomonas albilineans]|uniref:hypothetical protein n=1 Tax=Xanthomonas albilineans TaxID=29447 RepID=UPI000697005B|nr:hypothetical protein [Xanthomonas albilineans]
MMMSGPTDHDDDGRTRVVLGPVERWLVAAVAVAIIGGSTWVVTSVQSMLVEQAKTTTKLDGINKQLIDVPALKTDVTRMQDKIEQHEQAIRELQQLRNVK